MQMSSRLMTAILKATVGGLLSFLGLVPQVAAQNYLSPNPGLPSLGFVPGAASAGQIESVNPVAGNLNLSFPLAKLPPGPGGLSTTVNLLYSSAVTVAYVDTDGFVNGSGPYLRALYANAGSGLGTSGWNYGFSYNLWIASTPTFNGNTMYLGTPDGVNHLLLLTGTTNSSGTSYPASSYNLNYPGRAVYDIDYMGLCHNTTAACSNGYLAGTVSFASADSTFIRVVSNTATGQWIAYFPDGTQVLGTFGTFGSPNEYSVAAESNTLTDRNGNTITIGNFCSEGEACTTTIQDAQNRQIMITYGSAETDGQTWTDTISQVGVNGTLQALVNWGVYEATGPPAGYDCIYQGSGSFSTCPLNESFFAEYVVTSIQLPPGSSSEASAVYLFNYPAPSGSFSWGELHSMTRNALTSGAAITQCGQSSPYCPQLYQVNYSYYFDAANPSNPNQSKNRRWMNTLVNPLASKALTYNEQRDGATPVSLTETTNYTFPVPATFSNSSPPPVGGTSTVTAADGSQTTIYSSITPSCTATSGLCPAVVNQVVNPDGTQTQITWTSNTPPPGAPANPPSGLINAYPSSVVQSVGSVSKATSVLIDSNGNTKSLSEYDWFTGSTIPSTATRTTTSVFNTGVGQEYWNNTAPAYLRAPQSVTVGTAVTKFQYDYPLASANLIQLQQYDSTLGPSSSSSSYITSSWTYASKGNVLTATDPRGIVTNTIYSGSIYPTEVDVAYQKSEQRTTTLNYDPISGLLLTWTDTDNKVQTSYTYDNLGRQIQVQQAQTTSGGLNRTTTTQYDDVGLGVTTTQVQTQLSSATYYDPLGRVRLTIDAAGNRVQKAYRAGSNAVSYELQSNPYTPSDSTFGWTLTTRTLATPTANPTQETPTATTQVQTSFGGTPGGPWNGSPTASGTITTAAFQTGICTMETVTGPATSVTDQASNTTYYCQDGLGRLPGVKDASGAVTQHAYDLLDNLTQVTQGAQTRAFQYSTLSRLTAACNPETGTANCATSPLPTSGLETYTYDSAGNLLTKADASGVGTTFTGYDGLGRPASKSYINSSVTPTVTYTYDSDWKGALSSVGTSPNGATYSTSYTHDGFGRISGSAQITGSAPAYTLAYTYSLADRLTTIQYPSGRVVNYALDSAGRVSGVSATQNQITKYYTAQNTPIGYTAAGNIATLPLNNGVTETTSWNDRLQLTGQTATRSGSTLLGLGFFPCAAQTTSCTTGNTGSIQAQTITLPTSSVITQSYTYTGLNQLAMVTETGAQQAWSQTNNYSIGNRWLTQGSGASNMWPFNYSYNALTPENPNDYNAQNQLATAAAGNYSTPGDQQTTGALNSTYDAEGRIVSANVYNANNSWVQSISYVYDGEGQRVVKLVCQPGVSCSSQTLAATQTIYVYDAGGNLVAEYSTGAIPQFPCTTCYVTVDQLGSTRLVTDGSGNPMMRYDYLPFGEEIPADTVRTTTLGYEANPQTAPDGFNPKFTGQMRDTESGLDFFNARYYDSRQGRFVSPDPENAGADPTDPQTWNGYAYVANNPLAYFDPSGLGFWSSLGAALLDALTLGTSPLTNLGGCGGPLGSCGGFGDDLWNEQIPGAATVQNPGGFIYSEQQDAGTVTDQVSFGWSLVPVIGPGWQAIKDSKRGCVSGVVANTALAASDVFLVKSAYEGLSKGAWKLGSNSWSATRKWYGATRDLEFGQNVHHWAIPQGGWGKNVPNAIKNQPWNLMALEPPPGFSPNQWHNAIEGNGAAAMGLLGQLVYGTPAWAKNAAANVVGHVSRASNWVECR